MGVVERFNFIYRISQSLALVFRFHFGPLIAIGRVTFKTSFMFENVIIHWLSNYFKKWWLVKLVVANLQQDHRRTHNNGWLVPMALRSETRKRFARALAIRLLTSFKLLERVCNTELYILLVNTLNRVFQWGNLQTLHVVSCLVLGTALRVALARYCGFSAVWNLC